LNLSTRENKQKKKKVNRGNEKGEEKEGSMGGKVKGYDSSCEYQLLLNRRKEIFRTVMFSGGGGEKPEDSVKMRASKGEPTQREITC